MMGTPQVYPLVWNKQGQTPDGSNEPAIWDPLAEPPVPYRRDTTDPQADDIVKDQANPGKTPIETQVDKVQHHNDVAANTLAQKNRKRKQSSMELPFDPLIEEGTVYTLTGFAPNFDGNWLITEVVYSFTGKGGSRLNLELMQCLPPVQKTPGGATAGASAGASGGKSITVPAKPTPLDKLVYSGGINSVPSQPTNVPNLKETGDETSPNWLNAHGSLVADQQNLSLGNVGPVG